MAGLTAKSTEGPILVLPVAERAAGAGMALGFLPLSTSFEDNVAELMAKSSKGIRTDTGKGTGVQKYEKLTNFRMGCQNNAV